MKITHLIYNILLVLLFPLQLVLAQDLSLKKGAAVDSLPINDSIAENFAMYLPTNYENNKKWPIVFVFDPEGRGLNAARLFSAPANEQGYLVVASNNISKSDSLVENLEKASRLLQKILLSFPIDQERVYTAGLEEGGLVASALPMLYPGISGILVVDDIWMNNDYLTNKNKKPVIVGFAGYKSDAYNIFKQNSKLFEILNNKEIIYNYEGNGDWPSSRLISHGLSAFSLQTMLDGGQPKNTEIIDNLFQAELATAESWRRQLKFYKAFELLELMREKYKYFDKKNEIKELQKDIRRESLYKEQLSQYNSANAKEHELRYTFPYLLEEDLTSKSFENVGWWVQQFKEIDSLKNSKIEAEQEIGYRLEDFLQTYTKRKFTELKLEKAGIDKLVLISILRTVFDKKNPEGYFSIISLSALDGDYYTALLYLEDLLKTGYQDLEELYSIPGTLDLKLSPEFNDLVRKYVGESRY